jgi:hypothetical protein
MTAEHGSKYAMLKLQLIDFSLHVSPDLRAIPEWLLLVVVCVTLY